MGTGHAQVWIEHGDQAAEVDERIAPLVLTAWQLGFRTISSCEDQEGGPFRAGLIGFPSEEEARAFADLAGGTLFIPTTDDYAAASVASREAGYTQTGMAGVAFPVGTFVAASRRARARSARQRAAG